MTKKKPRKTVSTFTSRTSDKRYSVVLDRKSGRVTCTCPGFTHRGKCWHQTRVVDRIIDRGYKL